ncbi:hypothetical protein L873DRAFT_1704911 [Choiromyces venosus 120613-1]|uniref:Cyanovirin-N domain-containing protein n=1 Tax=Choiromyces venosus 120613-1 TaxID=1336337 RepID=A0A3N4J8Z3_9PEZI|nr:hypothetical protein L873DRAFT_1704911 [Choiromyces venosus 120613-1]
MSMSNHESSVYISLSGNQVLSALCRTCDGRWTIDLNTCLANVDGRFEWGGHRFSHTAKHVTLKDNRTLSAYLKRKNGSWSEKPEEVDLIEHITNKNGALRNCQHVREQQQDQDLSVAPSFLEKLNAVSEVLRNQQIAAKNSGFELDFISTLNSCLMLQELEVAFLRLRKLVGVISGEFDQDGEEDADADADAGMRKRADAEAAVRPMIKAFEKVRGKGDKSLAAVSRICGVTTEYETTNLPILRNDVESLRAEIDAKAKGAQVSVETMQEAVTTCAAELASTQEALNNVKSIKYKTNSVETLIKHAGWILLPIGLGMTLPLTATPLAEKIAATEQKLHDLTARHTSKQQELDTLKLTESTSALALRACKDLASQFTTLETNVVRLKTKAELAREGITTTLATAEILESLSREIEDKASMLEYKVCKKDYAAHVVRVLDEGLAGFAVVGDVNELLEQLLAGDDARGSVKELNAEIEAVKRKLEVVA